MTARDSAFVLVNLSNVANTAAKEDWCPACGERNAIRYLGTGPAALAAASITQLFTGNELDPVQNERKTLMFNDSVQDAAHRAGFVANRSYTFSLRALLTSYLDENEPVALNDLIATIVEKTTDPKTLAAVVPPDLHDHRGVQRLLSGAGRGGDQRTWRLIGERLAFATVMEFGFRSRQGRTLELTRTSAAQVRIPDAAVGAELVRTAHLGVRGQSPEEQDDARYLAFLRVFLERLQDPRCDQSPLAEELSVGGGDQPLLHLGAASRRHACLPEGRGSTAVPARQAQERHRVRRRRRTTSLARTVGTALSEGDA